MPLNVTHDVTEGVARITLSGELDASTAPLFKEAIEKAATGNIARLVLLMQDLEYMSSAGLRVLIFAKQKMGAVDIYMIGLQETVLDTLQKTGFDRSVVIQETYSD